MLLVWTSRMFYSSQNIVSMVKWAWRSMRNAYEICIQKCVTNFNRNTWRSLGGPRCGWEGKWTLKEYGFMMQTGRICPGWGAGLTYNEFSYSEEEKIISISWTHIVIEWIGSVLKLALAWHRKGNTFGTHTWICIMYVSFTWSQNSNELFYIYTSCP
jgi:hypothetical protein